MQDVVSETWRVRGAPLERHIGGLAWARYQHTGREEEWRNRLWERDAAVLAWARLHLPGTLDAQLHPDLVGGGLHDEVLAWFVAEAAEAEELTASALDVDEATKSALARNGFRLVRPEMWFVHLERSLSEPIPRPTRPDSASGTWATPGMMSNGASRYRAAFHPSRVTTESYGTVMRAFPYRPDLDWVVAPSAAAWHAR